MIQIEDILEELKDSSKIYYGDELFILPYHLISTSNSFKDLKKVTVTSVNTNGYNKNGCEITGNIITYDKEGYEKNNYYSGHAIYRFNKGKVITNSGEYFMSFDKEYYLSNSEKYRLYYIFRASNDLYIQISIGGNFEFKTKEEAVLFSKKINIRKCLLYPYKVECYIDNFKVIFKDYKIKYNNNTFVDDDSKKDLFRHMCNYEIPIKENAYKMEYSKVFNLSKIGFAVEKLNVQ